MNLKQEKMDEMRQDMLQEQKMREYDYFVDYVLNEYGDTLERLQNTCKMYEHDYKEIVNALMDSQ